MSDLEEALDFQIKIAKLPEPEREYRFNVWRKWRFDFAWPKYMIAAEIEGGLRNYGRHQRPQGFQQDAEKYNTAALARWRVFRFTPEMVRSGKALETIEKALDQERREEYE